MADATPTPPAQKPPAPPRERLTVFGWVLFIASIVLLLSGFVGALTRAESFLGDLAAGFAKVDVFAFWHNFYNDFMADLAYESRQPGGSAGVIIGVGLASLVQAIGQCLSTGFSDGWALLGFLMAITLGTMIVWDSMMKESWLYVFAIPLVGGVAAWVLSFGPIEAILWLGIFILHGAIIVGSVGSVAPRLTDAAAMLMDKFHLSKAVVSGASRAFGEGKTADALERMERTPKT